MELWKDVEGFEESYKVSSYGRVVSKTRMIVKKNGVVKSIEEKKIKPFQDRDGYDEVSLWAGNVGKKFKLHRLVLSHFVGNPENKPTVNHINGRKRDNMAINLEWATRAENSQHLFKYGPFNEENVSIS